MLLLLLLLLCALPLAGQEGIKFEREYRLSSAEVPAGPAAFVAAIEPDRRLKWYREESEKGTGLEAKFRRDGSHYSVEFDSTGQLLDIEVLVDWQTVPATAREGICDMLNGRFAKFRIRRLQRQWTGPDELLLRQVREGGKQPGVQTRYELVVRGRTDKGLTGLELLFDEQGRILEESRIVDRNTDNLDY